MVYPRTCPGKSTLTLSTAWQVIKIMITSPPLFFYESLWNVVNMAVLLWLARRFEKWLKPGDIFLIYMIMYSIGRFVSGVPALGCRASGRD